jgi:glycosyltransferase involved in cell wall biosynthesis
MDLYNRYVDILFIDDNSFDNSFRLLEKFSNRIENCFLIKNTQNDRGYGSAVSSGIKFAKRHNYSWAVICDTDLSNTLNELNRLIEICENTKLDSDLMIIKANRFWGGKVHMQGISLKRWVYSLSGNLVSRLFTGLVHPDPTNGFRAVSIKNYPSFKTKPGFDSILQEIYECILVGGKLKAFNTILRNDLALRQKSSFEFTPRLIMRYTTWSLKIGLVRFLRLIS